MSSVFIAKLVHVSETNQYERELVFGKLINKNIDNEIAGVVLVYAWEERSFLIRTGALFLL